MKFIKEINSIDSISNQWMTNFDFLFSFFFCFFFYFMRKSYKHIFFLSLFRVELKETRKRISTKFSTKQRNQWHINSLWLEENEKRMYWLSFGTPDLIICNENNIRKGLYFWKILFCRDCIFRDYIFLDIIMW